MKMDVIGVPLWEGSDNPGTEKGPELLLNAGLRDKIMQKHTLCSVQTLDFSREETEKSSMMHLAPVKNCCKKLEEAVAASVEADHFPLVLGGDHALAIGTLAGLNHKIPAKDLSVIWLDAHTDIHTDEDSDSHHIHGMPVSFAMGRGDRRLVESFGREEAKILPENIYYIGSRSVDPEEKETIEKLGIRMYDMDKIRAMGIPAVLKEILEEIHTPSLHLSFDVDFLDGDSYKATGLPVPDGPSVADGTACLKTLLGSGKVCSMDFVEYSPVHDSRGEGMRDCMTLLDAVLETLK